MIHQLNEVTDFIGNVQSYLPDADAVAAYQKYLPIFKQVEKLLAPAYDEIAQLQEEE